MHCNRFCQPLSRREMLGRCASGFGGVALAALMAQRDFGATPAGNDLATGGNPLVPRPPHFAAKAKHVIFLYMDGGVSQVDTFDPKPRLTAEHGQPFKMKMEPTQFNNNGSTFGSPWKFKQYGQSGMPVSELFPHVAECVDDLAVVRSMTSNFSEHTAANYFLHTGSGLQGPAEHGRLGLVRAGERVSESAGLRRAQRRPDSARRPGQFQQRLLAGHLSGLDVSPGQRAAGQCPPGGWAGRRAAAQAGPDAPAGQRSCTSVGRRATRWNRPSPTTNWRFACSRPCRSWWTSRARPKPPRSSTASTIPRPKSLAGSACWPGGWSSGACGSSS